MNFITWLIKQKARNDSIGDLSRDYLNDKNKDLITGYKSFQMYLQYHHACDSTVGALTKAYREYQESKK